ncbi:MAG: HNH endonuclease [Deltaproteobacteria bacterium]|nr:HNH endonuclease [Deltaproteobacteria bacterium]
MPDIALFDFVPELPVSELHAELKRANEISALGKRKLALYLFDMQRRGVHIRSGHSSAIHFATARLEMDKRRAQELVQIGTRLSELPLVDAALVAGDLSWSKMRHLIRVVVPETQGEWLERAEGSRCRELGIDVARTRRGERPRDRNEGGLPRQRIKVTASLDAIEYEIFERAKQKLSAECDERLTNEEMVVQIARLILRTDDDETQPGRSKVRHSEFQLIVHEDATGSHLHTQNGPVKLSRDLAGFMRRRAEVVPFARPANTDAKTPPGLVRRIRARDDGHCQSCGAVIHLHVHHVVFRSQGGKTEAANLLTVCARCHAMIHTGLLHVRADGKGGYYFLGGDGMPVERSQRAHACVGPGLPARS